MNYRYWFERLVKAFWYAKADAENMNAFVELQWILRRERRLTTAKILLWQDETCELEIWQSTEDEDGDPIRLQKYVVDEPLSVAVDLIKKQSWVEIPLREALDAYVEVLSQRRES